MLRSTNQAGNSDWSPTTDRNDAASIVDEVALRDKTHSVDYTLGCYNDDAYHAIRSGPGHIGSALQILETDPCLISYCACVALEEA